MLREVRIKRVWCASKLASYFLILSVFVDSFSILNVTVPGVAESLLPDDSVALEGDITEVISLSLANLHPLELNRRRVLFGDPSQSGLHAAANFTTADDDGRYPT